MRKWIFIYLRTSLGSKPLMRAGKPIIASGVLKKKLKGIEAPLTIVACVLGLLLTELQQKKPGVRSL